MQNADGKWCSFSVTNETMILEKISLPDHLKSLESADSAMSLTSVLCDLEDLGEVPSVMIMVNKCPKCLSYE